MGSGVRMMNSTDPSIGKRPIRQALEDAIVIGGFALLGGLIAAGTHFPPSIDTLYGSGLAAVLGGLTAYARARQIRRDPRG